MIEHCLYKITNNKNGKFYVGVHSSADLNDDYLGSGKLITQAIDKYGKESFDKTIMEVFESRNDAFAAEANIVTEEFVNSPLNYNLCVGGLGGDTMSSAQKEARSKRMSGKNHHLFGKAQSKKTIDKRVLALKGKKRTFEQKERMSKACTTKKSVKIDDITYPSITAASVALGLSRTAIRNRYF